MTSLGFNDSEKSYVHRLLRSKCIILFFCVSSSLKEQLSHLLYSFCLIPSHPLNSAVQFSQERVDLNCRITASSSIPRFSHHCKTVSIQPSPSLGTTAMVYLYPVVLYSITSRMFLISLLLIEHESSFLILERVGSKRSCIKL